MNIGIVIPAYNEERRIERTLNSYIQFFDKKNAHYSILVVVNNTTDNTVSVIKRVQNKHPQVSYLDLAPGGKGFAVKQGFSFFLDRDYDYIGFVDADLATPPESFFDLYTHMGNLDGSIANRYSPRSVLTPPLTFRRVVVAKVFNFVVRSLFLFPFQDTQCGAKLFTKNAARHAASIKISKWAFDVEMLYLLQRAGFRIKQIPTQWDDVAGGSINLVRDPIQMFLAVIQLRTIYSPFKSLLRPVKPFIAKLWRVVQ